MAFEELRYSKSQIDKAGEIIRKYFPVQGGMNNDLIEAMAILNNWRSSHSYVLNTFNATLREKAKRIDSSALIAQRLKRLPSIIKKLERRPTMRLSSMQDVGGIRAVMSDIGKIYKLEKDYKTKRFKHEPLKPDNYIDRPKESGYRSLHLLFRYKNEKAEIYNGLNIEIQLRTRKMHAWATAIETVDTFLKYSLKASEGPQEWLDYFKIASNSIAFIEDTPRLREFSSLSKQESFEITKENHKKLRVEYCLQGYTLAINHLTKTQNGSYYILILDLEKRELKYYSYGQNRLSEANERYAELEKQDETISGKKQIVLVSAESLEKLKLAYPNFFLDTHEYIKIIRDIKK